MGREQLKDLVWLLVARDISALSTCARRQVGVIFLDEGGRVLASGYNGVPAGSPHCIDNPCPGVSCASGTGLDSCEAIHAEQNALVQCKFPLSISTVYCTDSPCLHCVKMLSATSARRIVFSRVYPHSESRAYWEGRGGVWDHVPLPASPLNHKTALQSFYGSPEGAMIRSLRRIIAWLAKK